MDFRHQTAPPAGLADIDVDALVLVTGSVVDPALSPVLAALITEAVGEGELVLKKGKSLYAYRRPASPRAAFASSSRPTIRPRPSSPRWPLHSPA